MPKSRHPRRRLLFSSLGTIRETTYLNRQPSDWFRGWFLFLMGWTMRTADRHYPDGGYFAFRFCFKRSPEAYVAIYYAHTQTEARSSLRCLEYTTGLEEKHGPLVEDRCVGSCPMGVERELEQMHDELTKLEKRANRRYVAQKAEGDIW